MHAREIMTENPATLTPADGLADAARLMKRYDTGIVPVVESRGGNVLTGVITDRDMAVRHIAEEHGDGCTIGDHMSTTGLIVVRPDTDVEEVKRRMGEAQVRRIPVVDEQNRLLGIIAQADIARETDVEEVVERVSRPTAAARA